MVDVPRLRIGTAGWSYPDWRGVVYPRSPAKGFDPLRYLAAYVDTIEINSSFYRPPASHVAEKWAQTVRDLPGFTFTAKLYRGLTHAAPDDWETADIVACRDGFAPLQQAGLLGAVLVQFPFYFRATEANLDHVMRIRDALPDVPLVVEVRHSSFLAPQVLAAMDAAGLSFCNIDQPLSKTAIGPGARVTGPVGYLRLHGRNREAWFSKTAGRDEKYDYLYDPRELDGFVGLIDALNRGAEQVFVVTNNHFRGKALVNALELRERMEGQPVEVPIELLRAYPRLAAIAEEGFALE